jgi:hypothetical protein
LWRRASLSGERLVAELEELADEVAGDRVPDAEGDRDVEVLGLGQAVAVDVEYGDPIVGDAAEGVAVLFDFPAGPLRAAVSLKRWGAFPYRRRSRRMRGGRGRRGARGRGLAFTLTREVRRSAGHATSTG